MRTTTHACWTPASAERVWATLTSCAASGDLVPGVHLASDWTAGAAIETSIAGRRVPCGEVLVAESPHRLAWALDGGDGPATYVTWEVRPRTDGCIVRVVVDDLDADPGDPDAPVDEDHDPELVWLPVLAGLQARLLAGAPSSTSTDAEA
jgi:hypothetical protein